MADKVRRFRMLTDAYGVAPDIGIVRAGNVRMQGLLAHVRQLVAEGSAWEVEMEQRGEVDELARTIAWVEDHAAALVGYDPSTTRHGRIT